VLSQISNPRLDGCLVGSQVLHILIDHISHEKLTIAHAADNAPRYPSFALIQRTILIVARFLAAIFARGHTTERAKDHLSLRLELKPAGFTVRPLVKLCDAVFAEEN
jgi:hypothetical protein